ncbi:MAG: glycosyltransferase family 4 protein [Deltaproteobacteria bacterium]|nr:glycosyltransferase family 4 protein [Deltaproteobacteria bacterium]
MPRVLHVLNDFAGGGAERVVLELCRRAPVEQAVATVMSGGPLEAEFRAAGVPVIAGGRRSRALGAGAVARIAAVSRSFDIVHLHLAAGEIWGGLAAAIAGRAAISTNHNIDVDEDWERPARRLLEQRLRLTVAVSEAVARSCQARDIRVVPNGVDLPRFAAPWRGGTGVLAVGRRVPQKGFDVLAAAAPGLRVRVAGDGAYHAPGLEWLGRRDDVPALLAEADVLAVPSRWEGFGLAALEGMAAGVPVVASDVDGLAEVVGDAGVLVPPGNPRALREALDRVLLDRDFAQDLSRRGRERARRYGMERMVGSYVEIWRGL